MLAARHHGMAAIGVLWGYGSEEELSGAGAQALVREPQQLPGIIAAHAARKDNGGSPGDSAY